MYKSFKDLLKERREKKYASSGIRKADAWADTENIKYFIREAYVQLCNCGSLNNTYEFLIKWKLLY